MTTPRDESPLGALVEAPANSLPTWGECKLRCENSDYIAKRVAEGGYGPEADSLVATELHRFIYEYDDADRYKSAWFLHRLEKLIAYVRSTVLQASADGGVAEMRKYADELEADCVYPCCRETYRHCASIAEAALVRSAPGLRDGEGWQPIASAPRDTEVLVGWSDSAVQWIARQRDGAWWTAHGFDPLQTPTHWQPLPPSPAASGEVREGRG